MIIDQILGRLELQVEALTALRIDRLDKEQYDRLESILEQLMPLVYDVVESAYDGEQRH